MYFRALSDSLRWESVRELTGSSSSGVVLQWVEEKQAKDVTKHQLHP
jgi:hypothetical protein